MPRYAAIDIGTNSVLLLVAERVKDRFEAVIERAEITRLGRGVDKTRALSAEGMDATLAVLESFAKEARANGAEAIAVTATSAARDASNGAEFLRAAKQRAGVDVEIISGQLEAQLSFSAVADDPQVSDGSRPLIVMDIGGGSTEFIYGEEGKVSFRHSFDVGSVRLTERLVNTDPVSAEQQRNVRELLAKSFSALPSPPPRAQFVGVAGTVTTLFAVHHAVEPYDVKRVHGGKLSLAEVRAVVKTLCTTPLESRRKLPGLQPKRADVIPAGALIMLVAMEQLGVEEITVSDRGVRWGLIAHKFGGRP